MSSFPGAAGGLGSTMFVFFSSSITSKSFVLGLELWLLVMFVDSNGKFVFEKFSFLVVLLFSFLAGIVSSVELVESLEEIILY